MTEAEGALAAELERRRVLISELRRHLKAMMHALNLYLGLPPDQMW